jgi:hypothetical protein
MYWSERMNTYNGQEEGYPGYDSGRQVADRENLAINGLSEIKKGADGNQDSPKLEESLRKRSDKYSIEVPSKSGGKYHGINDGEGLDMRRDRKDRGTNPLDRKIAENLPQKPNQGASNNFGSGKHKKIKKNLEIEIDSDSERTVEYPNRDKKNQKPD